MKRKRSDPRIDKLLAKIEAEQQRYERAQKQLYRAVGRMRTAERRIKDWNRRLHRLYQENARCGTRKEGSSPAPTPDGTS